MYYIYLRVEHPEFSCQNYEKERGERLFLFLSMMFFENPIVVIEKSNLSIEKAKTGTNSPPRCMPDMAMDIAKERRLSNQLLTIATIANHPPKPEPKEIVIKAA